MLFFAIIIIFQNILVITLTIIFALTGKDISYSVIGLILPIILMSLFSLFYVRKYLTKLNILDVMPQIKTLFVFGFYVVLAGGVSTISNYTDSALLGYYLTAKDVGLYSVAIISLPVLSLPSSAVQVITSPMIAQYWGKNELGNIEKLINRCMKLSALYAVVVAFAIGSFSKELITLLRFSTTYRVP